MGMSAKEKNFYRRSGLGFARFEEAQANKFIDHLKTQVRDKKTWELEEFTDKPMEVIPARLMDFYFESDDEGEVKFSFRGQFSKLRATRSLSHRCGLGGRECKMRVNRPEAVSTWGAGWAWG